MRRRLLTALLALTLALSLGACGEEDGEPGGTGAGTGPAVPQAGEGETLPFQGADGWEFQKNMHQSAFGDLAHIGKSETGYYFQFNRTLYYLDGTSGRVTVLCPRPDCGHTDESCGAWAGAYALWYTGGRLYFAKRDYERVGERFTELGKRVYSLEPDGTGRREAMSLELGPVGGEPLSSFDGPICHRGTVYFVYNGVLYCVPLEGDAGEAERIWGEDRAAGGDGGYTAYNPATPRYTLWADGDTVYFMLNVTQKDGTQKDTLFACDILTKDVRQVWQVPEGDAVGSWETTGVSVSQWYVLDGAVYFYLSGGDFWKTDLETHKSVKLADTGDKTLYGTAVFSDEYMCLLNDRPIVDPASGELWLGAGLHEGGDTVYVYRLDGTPVRELPLAGLWDTLGEIAGFCPVFCDGEALWLIADAGTMVPTDFGQQKSRRDVCAART